MLRSWRRHAASLTGCGSGRLWVLLVLLLSMLLCLCCVGQQRPTSIEPTACQHQQMKPACHGQTPSTHTTCIRSNQHGKDPQLASGAVNAGRSPGCLKHGACCRSGRTGRAGSSGTCVVLVDKKKEGLIPLIERKAGLKMQRIGTPQPSDLARVAGLPLGLQCPEFRVQAASGLCWLSAALQILAAAAPVQLQLVTLDQSNCCV